MAQKRPAQAAGDEAQHAGQEARDEVRLTSEDPKAGVARAGRAAETGGREVERDVEQHPRAVAGGAVTGAAGGAVLGGPPGAVVGAITGAARGLLAADALDLAKKQLGKQHSDGTRDEPHEGQPREGQPRDGRQPDANSAALGQDERRDGR